MLHLVDSQEPCDYCGNQSVRHSESVRCLDGQNGYLLSPVTIETGVDVQPEVIDGQVWVRYGERERGPYTSWLEAKEAVA